jgi:hypothetical protein
VTRKEGLNGVKLFPIQKFCPFCGIETERNVSPYESFPKYFLYLYFGLMILSDYLKSENGILIAKMVALISIFTGLFVILLIDLVILRKWFRYKLKPEVANTCPENEP